MSIKDKIFPNKKNTINEMFKDTDLNKDNLLSLKDLTIKFGGVVAVNQLNLDVNTGEIVSLIGPNGAGKTTAFNCVTGLYTPSSGDIFYEGGRLNGLKPNQIVSLGISRTFQNIRLFSKLSVFDNVLIAKHLRAKDNIFTSTTRLNYKEEKKMREEAKLLLEEQGLYELKDEIASSLPYGLQRRLEIARALATKPKLLMLDEPAAGMNPKETADLTKLIFDIRDKYKISILMIEHHMDLVMDISERIYVLEFGKLIANGTPSEIQDDEKVIKAYLGGE